jgi:hypothetical protein
LLQRKADSCSPDPLSLHLCLSSCVVCNRDNLNDIEDIYISLDSHHKNHVAHASFWRSSSSSSSSDGEAGEGEQPGVFSLISADEVNKKWFPVDPSLQEYVARYTKQLEAKGHYKLTIWPEHCIVSTRTTCISR